MLSKLRHFALGKMIVGMFALFTLALVAESCGQKNACGSRHQKKMRHKRIKKGTTFMSGQPTP